MRVYFLLIVADKEINLKSRFYRVGVGSSKFDVSCSQKIAFWANSKGYFFKKIDSQVDDFYFRIAKSLGMQVFQLPRQLINVADLWRHVQACDDVPALSPQSYSAGFASRMLMPSEFFKHQSNVIHQAEAMRRNKPKVDSIRVRLKDTL